MSIDLNGTGVALVTPFTGEGKVDESSLRKIVNHVTGGGADYLVVLGTTGETATLGSEEKQQVKQIIADENHGRLPLVIGIGGNNTQALTDELKSSDLSAFSAVLSVAPYYNKPNQQGLFEHYKKIAEASPLPVILYNVPGRTGVNMEPETCFALARECKNIVAVKEASGNIKQVMELIKGAPENFKVISGDDDLAAASTYLGAAGVISVFANAFPKQCSDMIHAAQKKDLGTANKILYRYLKLISLLFKEGNPAGVKAAMDHLGLCSPYVRLPLVRASESLKKELLSEMELLQAFLK